MKRLTVRADEVKVGDRPTEWCGFGIYGPAEGPGEPITELTRVGAYESADALSADSLAGGFIEAWTETGVIAGMPAVNARPGERVEVWR